MFSWSSKDLQGHAIYFKKLAKNENLESRVIKLIVVKT